MIIIYPSKDLERINKLLIHGTLGLLQGYKYTYMDTCISTVTIGYKNEPGYSIS